ncbi:RNA polymerase sigma-70 factor [Paenibacillus sp. NPDC056579]|uniref:RNA polymerase sigma-70 factor n=1 Tax=Paenibacillus sp. NPDC056579 TaxID=3345871 RepID=UPI0036816222
MELEQAYRDYKPLLFSIAYKMLGSVSDAEDIVQDCFVTARQVQWDHVGNEKSYLCKTVTNRCLDHLKSARKKRELYIGPWLPEPLVQDASEDPQEHLILEDTITYAFLIMLETLTPLERAVFVLRESFGYEYEEIAAMVGRTEVACRKTFSRVKRKVQQAQPPSSLPSLEETEHIVKRFIHAASTGNMEELIAMMTEDIILVSDGGGKVHAAVRPIVSRAHVIAFLKGVVSKLSPESVIHTAVINGQAGIVLSGGEYQNTVLSYELDESRKLKRIFVVSNPDKLEHVAQGLQ